MKGGEISQGIEKLDKHTQATYEWLNDIADVMQLGNRTDIVLQALRGVLHAIRDRLIPAEVFDLSAQLPLIIRGLYFDGYRISNKPEKYDAKELLDRIFKSFGGRKNIEPRAALKAVLLVLYSRISKGQMDDIYNGMPQDIKKLWDESLTQTNQD